MEINSNQKYTIELIIVLVEYMLLSRILVHSVLQLFWIISSSFLDYLPFLYIASMSWSYIFSTVVYCFCFLFFCFLFVFCLFFYLFCFGLYFFLGGGGANIFRGVCFYFVCLFVFVWFLFICLFVSFFCYDITDLVFLYFCFFVFLNLFIHFMGGGGCPVMEWWLVLDFQTTCLTSGFATHTHFMRYDFQTPTEGLSFQRSVNCNIPGFLPQQVW